MQQNFIKRERLQCGHFAQVPIYKLSRPHVTFIQIGAQYLRPIEYFVSSVGITHGTMGCDNYHPVFRIPAAIPLIVNKAPRNSSPLL